MRAYRVCIMNWVNDWLVRVSFMLRLETGAVSAEYGLILTLVVLVTVLAIGAFGVAVSGLIDRGASGVPSPP
jgi:Flp pilus assembly pilin Flp